MKKSGSSQWCPSCYGLAMKIALLDRDGTIIQDPKDERVDSIDKIKLFPDTLEALNCLHTNGFSVIIITNQAGIAEGRIDEQNFNRIHNKVLDLLKPSGVKILKTFMCPHGPNDGCACRKPKPTMILAAAKEFGINLSEVYMVGDNISDIEAGINAGTKTILVETARNKKVVADHATYTAPNLFDAVKHIVDN